MPKEQPVRDFDQEFGFDEKGYSPFKLGGVTFHAKPNLHPSIFLSRRDDEKGLDGALRIIRGCIPVKELEAFQNLLDDPDVMVSAQQIDAVAMWLLEVASESPTESPLPSGGGGETTGNGSKATSSATASTGK